MDAFDASHFDVCGGARAGNVGCEGRGDHRKVFLAGMGVGLLPTAVEVLGQHLYYLAGAEDA